MSQTNQRIDGKRLWDTLMSFAQIGGTAKGGVVLGIVDQFKIPVKYIGIGEKKEDLQLFNRMDFVDSLFKTAE